MFSPCQIIAKLHRKTPFHYTCNRTLHGQICGLERNLKLCISSSKPNPLKVQHSFCKQICHGCTIKSESDEILFPVLLTESLKSVNSYKHRFEQLITSSNLTFTLDTRANTCYKLPILHFSIFSQTWITVFQHLYITIIKKKNIRLKCLKQIPFRNITNLPWAWKSRRKNWSSCDTALLARWCFWCNKSTS